MPDSLAPVLWDDDVHHQDLLHTLLAIAQTGVLLLRPLYAAASATPLDFAWVQLNPAAQRMLRLPACPAESFLTLFPMAQATGVFGFYRDAFLSGQVEHRQNNYQHDGLDGYYLLVAQRQGGLLVVSFTDTNEHPRSAVEEELRQSQAREVAAHAEAERQRGELARLFAQAPVAMALFRGPEYIIELANESMAAVWSRPLTQVLGQPVFEALPYLRNQGFEALFAEVLAQGTPIDLHEVPVTIDRVPGQPALGYFNLTFRPQRDAWGRITGIITSAHDVTEQVLARRQVEQLNQELEERVQQRTQQTLALQAELLATAQAQVRERETCYQVFTQAPAAICIQRGPAHRYEYVNAAYQRFFPGRELLGNDLAAAVPETVAGGLLALLDQVYQTGETYYGYEVPVLLDQPDGSTRQEYVNFTYQPYRENGEVVGISTFAYDVAELVRVKQAREAQQRELERLFEQAPMAIVVLRGPRFIIEQANVNAEAIWGRTAAEVLGRPHFEALPEAAGQGFEEMLTGVLKTGEAVVLREVPIELARTHTGLPNVGYYTIIFKPLFDGGAHATRIVVMWTETTDQVLARQQVQALNAELTTTNEELHTSNTQLTRTNVDLDTFVYTASHDLKAPIANIESITLALRATLPAEVQQDELVAHLLELLSQTTARFQFTIGQLTDLSKLQLAHAGPAEPVPLAEVIESVRLDLVPLLAAAEAQLTVEVAPELMASFSPANLRSAVYNLLSNAVKYRSPARPARVLVRAFPAGPRVVLEVQDNGLGLNAHQQARLFGLFQRLHTHVEGTGVGLYITKRLVENGGGTITVASQEAVGTTFTLTFPA